MQYGMVIDTSGYAFTTQEWKSCNFKVVELTDVKRQEDREFIEKLNEIRVGNFTNLDYWKQFINENLLQRRLFQERQQLRSLLQSHEHRSEL